MIVSKTLSVGGPLDHGVMKATLITLEEALSALQEEAMLQEKKKKKPKSIMHNLSGGGRDSGMLSLILDKLHKSLL